MMRSVRPPVADPTREFCPRYRSNGSRYPPATVEPNTAHAAKLSPAYRNLHLRRVGGRIREDPEPRGIGFVLSVHVEHQLSRPDTDQRGSHDIRDPMFIVAHSAHAYRRRACIGGDRDIPRIVVGLAGRGGQSEDGSGGTGNERVAFVEEGEM